MSCFVLFQNISKQHKETAHLDNGDDKSTQSYSIRFFLNLQSIYPVIELHILQKLDMLL